MAAVAAQFSTVPAGAAGQEQPPFRSGVDILEVDVTVTEDRGRRAVIGLDAADFRVRIGGAERRVVQARLVSPPPSTTRRPARRPPSAPASFASPDALRTSNAGATLASGAGRLVVLAVDPESIAFGQGRQLLRTAAEFVERLHPADRVALVEVPGSAIRIPPTDDHDRVRQAVARMGGIGAPPGRVLCPGIDARLTLIEAFRIAVYGSTDDLQEALRRGVAICRIDPAASVRTEAGLMVAEAGVRTRQAIRAMESVLRTVRDVEGQKLVVWISGGLPIDTNVTLLRQMEEEAATSRAPIVALMVPEPDIDNEGRFENPRPPRLRTQTRLLLEHGLSLAADLTGGEFYRAIGNGRGVFERIEAQLAGHYRLAVEVGPRERIDRRRVEVAVARRGARARVRHAAVGEDRGSAAGVGASGNQAGAAGVAARVEGVAAGRPVAGGAVAGVSTDDRLRAMLRAPEVESTLPLRVSTYAYPDRGGRARVAVRAEVGGGGVDGSEVTLAYALLDSWGEMLSSGRRRRAGAAPDSQGDGRYAYEFPLAAGPGRYALRVAAVDGDGRGGSVEHPLRVGLVLSDAPLVLGALEVRDAASGAVEGIPVAAGAERETAEEHPNTGAGAAPSDPVVSSGQLEVSLDVRAESAWVFHRIRVTVEVARDKDGPALVESEAPLRGRDDESGRRATVRLPVGALAAGAYVARVRALRGTELAALAWRMFRIAE